MQIRAHLPGCPWSVPLPRTPGSKSKQATKTLRWNASGEKGCAYIGICILPHHFNLEGVTGSGALLTGRLFEKQAEE